MREKYLHIIIIYLSSNKVLSLKKEFEFCFWSVDMFVCPIVTYKQINRFASNFDLGTRKNHGKENLVTRQN